MADLAAVFHWSAAAMERMTIAELMSWHAHAARRSQK